jgi:hypothetical protein
MNGPFIRLGIAIVLFAGVLGGYWVWYSVVADQSARAVELQSQIDTKTSLEQRAAAARTELSEISSDEAAVQQHFVSNDTIVSFLGDLENRGVATGATVKVLSVSSATITGHAALQINLQINGTFPAVMNTIGSIEYAPYDLSVATLSLNQSAGGSGAAPNTASLWSASVNILVGSAPGNATSTAATGTTKPATITAPAAASSSAATVQPL